MQGEELKAMRKALGMSQQQLAEAIGMSRKAIGEMERGDAPIEKRTGMAVRFLADGPARTTTEAASAGRRAPLLQLDNAQSIDRAQRVLLECSDILNDGFHVTLVEDLRDISAALGRGLRIVKPGSAISKGVC